MCLYYISYTLQYDLADFRTSSQYVLGNSFPLITYNFEFRYLHLVTKEHNLLKEEKKLTTEFTLSEREERECFTSLSSSVKDSHEKERAQAERTKYWSVIGSVVGTVIGVVGTTINNEFKMRQLRKLVSFI